MDTESNMEWNFVDAAGDWVAVRCPYCGEHLEILLDPEVEGDLVQDCEVCCNPWQLRVLRAGGEGPIVLVEQL